MIADDRRSTELVREVSGGDLYEYYPLGEYIVAAPGVCGGEPTFKYTRINVSLVLDRLEAGENPDEIVTAYSHRITGAAIEEALRLQQERSPNFFHEPYRPTGRAA